MDEPEAWVDHTQFQLLSELDGQITRFDENLVQLSQELNPVLESEGPETSVQAPEEAPYHDFHNSVLRLRRVNVRLEDIRRRIRL